MSTYGTVKQVGANLASENRENLYEVVFSADSNSRSDAHRGSSYITGEEQLIFAPGTPVWIASKENMKDINEKYLPYERGVVLGSNHDLRYSVATTVSHQQPSNDDRATLLASKSLAYTVQSFAKDPSDRLHFDVKPEQVKYRYPSSRSKESSAAEPLLASTQRQKPTILSTAKVLTENKALQNKQEATTVVESSGKRNMEDMMALHATARVRSRSYASVAYAATDTNNANGHFIQKGPDNKRSKADRSNGAQKKSDKRIKTTAGSHRMLLKLPLALGTRYLKDIIHGPHGVRKSKLYEKYSCAFTVELEKDVFVVQLEGHNGRDLNDCRREIDMTIFDELCPELRPYYLKNRGLLNNFRVQNGGIVRCANPYAENFNESTGELTYVETLSFPSNGRLSIHHAFHWAQDLNQRFDSACHVELIEQLYSHPDIPSHFALTSYNYNSIFQCQEILTSWLCSI